MTLTLVSIPEDILWQIGSFQTASELLRMTQTCSVMFRKLQRIVQNFARMEQDRMEIPYFCTRLTHARVVWEWGQLSPDWCRSVRIHLARAPLVFYSGRFESITVLLSENVIGTQMNRNERISLLVGQENDIPRAMILISSLRDRYLKGVELCALALREDVPLETALEIARKIPHEIWKSWTLGRLAVRKEIPWIQSIEIAFTISDRKIRKIALQEIAKKT